MWEMIEVIKQRLVMVQLQFMGNFKHKQINIINQFHSFTNLCSGTYKNFIYRIII